MKISKLHHQGSCMFFSWGACYFAELCKLTSLSLLWCKGSGIGHTEDILTCHSKCSNNLHNTINTGQIHLLLNTCLVLRSLNFVSCKLWKRVISLFTFLINKEFGDLTYTVVALCTVFVCAKLPPEQKSNQPS